MSKQNKVVVVEGYHDLDKLLKVFPDLDIVITNGSEISKNTLEELKILNKSRGLILLLDPDYQGERIRRIINDYVGETSHAFIDKKKCISKNRKKVGIEHASFKDIREALEKTISSHNDKQESISLKTLYKLKLLGYKNSKQLREKITNNLGIGLSNGKTLYKKLNMFQITEEQIIKILRT